MHLYIKSLNSIDNKRIALPSALPIRKQCPAVNQIGGLTTEKCLSIVRLLLYVSPILRQKIVHNKSSQADIQYTILYCFTKK